MEVVAAVWLGRVGRRLNVHERFQEVQEIAGDNWREVGSATGNRTRV